MNIERTNHIFIREVTEHLPLMPDRELGECDGEVYTEPHSYTKGRWFYVELHVSNFGLYGPAGIAVVQIIDYEDYHIADLSSLFVNDCLRREGCARELVEAAGAQWPNLTWLDTASSRDFHERLVKDGLAKQITKPGWQSSGHYQFIPESNRKSKRKSKRKEVSCD